MSSLTDIIFLLLIFFMLTSTIVAPNALNLKLPSPSKSNQPPPNEDIDQVSIGRDCVYRFNGEQKGVGGLETTLRQRARGRNNYSVLIAYQPETSTECVVNVMDMARRLDINAILAAPKTR